MFDLQLVNWKLIALTFDFPPGIVDLVEYFHKRLNITDVGRLGAELMGEACSFKRNAVYKYCTRWYIDNGNIIYEKDVAIDGNRSINHTKFRYQYKYKLRSPLDFIIWMDDAKNARDKFASLLPDMCPESAVLIREINGFTTKNMAQFGVSFCLPDSLCM